VNPRSVTPISRRFFVHSHSSCKREPLLYINAGHSMLLVCSTRNKTTPFGASYPTKPDMSITWSGRVSECKATLTLLLLRTGRAHVKDRTVLRHQNRSDYPDPSRGCRNISRSGNYERHLYLLRCHY
jgi:hypothetical protein